MDRYNEVKLLLKNWEQTFVKQHQRKPGKEDIDQAPEETRKLYKEYRSLKQVKENNSSRDAESSHALSRPTAEVNTGHKESDCWGAHLNRSSKPVSSPRLMSEDKHSLKASAQYYGLKLKNNLAALSKERPVSLKKSSLSSRVPLNSVKEEKQTGQTNGPIAGAATAKATCPEASPFSPRRLKTCLGSLASKTLHPVEPEEPFEPFRESSDESTDAASSCNSSNKSSVSNSKGITSELYNGSSLTHSPTTTSPFLSSLSPPCSLGISRGDGETTGQSNESSAVSGDMKGNAESLGTLSRDIGSTVTSAGLRGSPQFLGSFRGGRGIGGKPSPASRLSLVDKKWLERCQVFGEMGEEKRPGAGNQPIDVEKRGESERGKETEQKETQGDERVGNGKIQQDGEQRKGEADLGRDEGCKNSTGDKIGSDTVPTRQPTRKSKGGREEKEKRKQGEEMESGLIPPPTQEDDGLTSPKSKGTKKRGRKRQREGDDVDRETTEDGGAKKKRRNGKKKEQSGDVTYSPTEGGGKKRRAKKKGDENGEGEEDKETKAPKKVSQENLLGEIEEEFITRRMYHTQPIRARNMKGADGNYVKINLKKKSHVKGYALRGVALRKQLYMQKFQLKGERFGGGGGHFGRGWRRGFRGGLSRQGDTCYKCGGTGHWAIDCKGRAPPPPVSDEQPAEEETFELPTLEEVARATGTLRPELLMSSSSVQDEHQHQEDDVDHKHKDEVLLNVIRPEYERPAPPPPMEPLYPLTDDGKVQETPTEVYTALGDLGYQSFRPGQEEAIMRILSGVSLPCDAVNSLLCMSVVCFQLSGLPAKLKAACIHSNMTMKQREAAIEKVKSGQVCVLLLSPEALVGGGGSGSGCLPSAQELPPVAFACIDEAHCVSEWSHNFRPCYLRLCKVLRERLGVHCLLGLTATATLSTALDIARHLDINDQDGIAVRSAAVPPNLHLSVSMDREKDQALVSLLKGDRFGCLDSIIVYCTRREETVRVAALLRTCLQERPGKKIRKPLKWQAESYHAGLSAGERRRVQNNFMCGELRIVVATVAFGMGLDKSDVRGIIHYNMPKSFESYVQEIGRAGRDGEPAHCHLFLDPEGGDLHELRRHIYADTVDYYTVKRLVQKVFPPCKCRQIHQKQQELFKVTPPVCVVEQAGPRLCHTHERAIPIQQTVEALDITEEGVETMLCYLELHPQRFVELLHPTMSVCKVSCYDGPRQLQKITKICPPVAVILARKRLAGERVETCDQLEFDVVEVADTMGWQLPLVKRGLRQLQWSTDRGGGRSGILVEFSSPSFYFRSYGDLSDEEMDRVCQFLHNRVQDQEKTQLYQLTTCFKAFKSVAFQSVLSCVDNLDESRSLQLKNLLSEYFDKRRDKDHTLKPVDIEELDKYKLLDWENQIRADIRSFLCTRSDEKFSGRAVARILHGIGSPCFPAQTYGRDRRFWRKYIQFDFNQLIRLATQEIICFK
uniref:DNA 3'-5' helicase n=1 Tax=Anabas testudineus TaxID=64144 RepID=A0A3Q1IGJ1_ANATE